MQYLKIFTSIYHFCLVNGNFLKFVNLQDYIDPSLREPILFTVKVEFTFALTSSKPGYPFTKFIVVRKCRSD